MCVRVFKTLIVGTHYNRLAEAVLMSTHNLSYSPKIRKQSVFFLITMEIKEVYFSWPCYPGVVCPFFFLHRCL